MKNILSMLICLCLLHQLLKVSGQWNSVVNSLHNKSTYGSLYNQIDSWYNPSNQAQLSPFIQCKLEAQSIIYLDGADPSKSKAFYYIQFGSYAHKQAFLTLDLYFRGVWDSGVVQLVLGSWNTTITYTNPTTMPFTGGFCDSLAFDIQSFSFLVPRIQSGAFTITIVAPSGQVGVRNFHTSQLRCHYSCKTCFGTDDNQCLTCFSGIIVDSGKCSSCPSITPYLDLQYGCQNYCDRQQVKDSNNVCQTFIEIYYGYDYFYYIIYYQTYVRKWSQIYDPQHVDGGSKENICSSLYFYGPFTAKAGTSRALNLPSGRNFPVKIILYLIILGQLQENSGIQVKLNNTYVGSLAYFNSQYILDNMVIGANNSYNSVCLTYQSFYYLTLVLTIPAAPSEMGLFTIIGNLSQPTLEAWGIRYSFILVGRCPNYCSVCDETGYCISCLFASYTLFKGNCYPWSVCPQSVGYLNSSHLCEPYESHPYSNAAFKGFYDFMPYEGMDSIFTLLNQTGTNFMKGPNNYTSYTFTRRIFGGPYIWAQAAFSATFSLPNLHYATSVHFTIIFGSNFTLGNFSYQIEQNPVVTLGKSNCTTSNLIGNANMEYLYQVHELLSTHNTNTLALIVHCFGNTNSVQYAYCGIQDLFIVEHQCQPYCLACTSSTDCTSWNSTYDSSIIKFDGSTCLLNQYYSRLQYQCFDCSSLCPTCITFERCTSCISTYTLFNYQCVCLITQYLDLAVPQCLDCLQPCLTCSSFNYCTDCFSDHIRILNNGICECATNYYEEAGNFVCQPCNQYCTACNGPDNGQCSACISLTNFILDAGTCRCSDNFYYSQVTKVCETCHYSCLMCYDNQLNNCLSCSSANHRALVGLNCPCQLGFYEATSVSLCSACPALLNPALLDCYRLCGDGSSVWHNVVCPTVTCGLGYQNQSYQCSPICGDGLQVAGEDCDDGNSNQFDGCHNCVFQCSPNCLTCDATTIFPCKDICGDGIISGTEECDDGNSTQYDGCFNCLYQCQSQCTKCIKGICYECSTPGWKLNEVDFTCIENCGDSLVVNREQCDDSNSNPEDGCDNCRFLCRSDCLECDSTGRVCLKCLPGFTPFSYYCKNICGDGKIVSSAFYTEQCDDFNSINSDGCSSSCQFQCQAATICLLCDAQKECQSCAPEYRLNQQKNKCEEICGDNLIVGAENCEDLNNRMYDGCYKCRYQCQIECANCSSGVCLQCKAGYFLDKFNNQCSPTCGDKIIVQPEQCDDGNLVFDDGCHNCQFNCQDSCQHCLYGKCYTCKDGFYLNSIDLCKPILKDLLILPNESIVTVNKDCENESRDQLLKGEQECVDGYPIVFDGCFENQKSNYQNKCLVSYDKICLQCNNEIGWYLNAFGYCESFCGDNILVPGLEECDDGNDIKNDGCSDCQLDCQISCTKCVKNICYECNTSGWYLADDICKPICGDGLLVYSEQCDDGNDEMYDGCYECKFQCEENCNQCVNGVCFDCILGWEINPLNICQAVCGDSIVIHPQEDCDDGNQFQFDGCYKCRFQCEELCTTCIEGVCYECDILGWQINENHKCEPICNDGLVMGLEECDDMNLIPYDGCFECKFQCHEQCLLCEKGVCLKCDYGYNTYLDQCESFCGNGQKVQLEECDDGNLNNVDGCSSECKIEENWACVTESYQVSECFYSKLPKLLLGLIEYNSTMQIVYLKFDIEMQLISIDIQPQFSFRILDLQDNQYQVLVTPIIPLSLEAQFVEYNLYIYFNISVYGPTLIVNVSNITNQNHQILNTIESRIYLRDSEVMSEGEKQATQAASSFSLIVLYTICSIAVIAIFTGSLEMVWNLLDMVQFLSYVKYVNIDFPLNLDTYFEVFKLISISPLLQYIGVDAALSTMNGGVTPFVQTVNKFKEDEINAYFLSNYITFLLCIILAYSNYLISIIMCNFIQKLRPWALMRLNFTLLKVLHKLGVYFMNNIKEFYYSVIIRIFLANYYEVMFASCIQMTNLNWDNANMAVNSALAILVLWGQAYFIFIIFSKQASFTKRTTISNKIKYISMFEGVRQKSTDYWGLQLNSVLLLKKFIFMIIIVNCQGDGAIQTMYLSLSSTIYLTYIIKTKPFESKSEFIKQIINESTISVISLSFMIYKYQRVLQLNYSLVMIVGWIHIALFSIILCSTLVIDLYNQILIIFERCKSQSSQNQQIEQSQIKQESTLQSRATQSNYLNNFLQLNCNIKSKDIIQRNIFPETDNIKNSSLQIPKDVHNLQSTAQFTAPTQFNQNNSFIKSSMGVNAQLNKIYFAGDQII